MNIMKELTEYRLRALEQAVAELQQRHRDEMAEILKRSLPDQVEMAPPVPEKLATDLVSFRYFKDCEAFWKMPPVGKGFIRLIHHKQWTNSALSLKLLVSFGEMEITPEEGEPCSQPT
jgi:hypothetical protein